MKSQIDPGILKELPGSPNEYTFPHRSLFSFTSFGSTMQINRLDKPTYFLKLASSQHLVQGEYNALKYISAAVPGFCPEPVAIGRCESSPNKYFVVSTFLNELHHGGGADFERKLARKVAAMHTARPQSQVYGLPSGEPTCCGSTELFNQPTTSWSEFFTIHRLRFICDENARQNGFDSTMNRLVNLVIEKAVPALLEAVKSSPSLIHGDLWRGNVGSIRIPDSNNPTTYVEEPVIYDSCAYYADSEFELGIMKMFGGFSSVFWDEYHTLVPKKEPVRDYDDRLRLYQAFHELNHSAMFGGGGYDLQAKASLRYILAKFE
ncbi:Fructosamine/Ketosamine-3-kinase [Lipomyces oligophaga]|uniref:Fructosamine/Ketosamine-3-kinase n=1 Tax=Lipomyces oligophaga TaxID=45792 RepID=UPI0034CF825D